ncbi:MAG: family 10 glycosylhydrolase, partial [Microcoleus sp. PH2017_22_RUC_O_B]|uniref:family 10 glycosylhydrolase n=1 Tax=unclassified Microcoleus TaxID=2642155 RepID=UPI001D82590E
KDGKYLPSESESKRGGFDPKKTGQTNDLPKFGEAPRLNKAPKRVVPPELNKKPKPSQDIFQPISYNSYPKDVFGGNVPDNLFAGPGGPGSPPNWPPPGIEAYWLPNTFGLATTKEERSRLFQNILRNKSIKKIYMNALAAAGATFTNGVVARTQLLKSQDADVFAEFQDALRVSGRADVEVVPWFEGTGMAMNPQKSSAVSQTGTTLFGVAKSHNAVLSKYLAGDPSVPYIDILNPTVFATLKNLIIDFFDRNPTAKEIILDDHFGIPFDVQDEVIAKHRQQIEQDGYKDKPLSWIREKFTSQLLAIKQELTKRGKILSVSTHLFPPYTIVQDSPDGNVEKNWALRYGNQDIKAWLEQGILDEKSTLNVQLYRGGTPAELQALKKDYGKLQSDIRMLTGELEYPNGQKYKTVAPTKLPSISVSLAANKEKTSRESIRQQIDIIKGARINGKPVKMAGFNFSQFLNAKVDQGG